MEICRLESKCLSFVMHRSPCSQKSHVFIRAAIWKTVSGDESEIVESKMRTGQRREKCLTIDKWESNIFINFLHLDMIRMNEKHWFILLIDFRYRKRVLLKNRAGVGQILSILDNEAIFVQFFVLFCCSEMNTIEWREDSDDTWTKARGVCEVILQTLDGQMLKSLNFQRSAGLH